MITKAINIKKYSKDGDWEVCKWYIWGMDKPANVSYHQYFRCDCGDGSHTMEVSVDECGPDDMAPYTFSVCWLGQSEAFAVSLWHRIRGAIRYVLQKDRELYHHIISMDECTYDKFAKAVNDAKELVTKLNKQYAEDNKNEQTDSKI